MTKIIEDRMPQAKGVLEETVHLVKELRNVANSLELFTEEMRQEYATLPRYIAATAVALRTADISGFDVNYPCLSSILADGQGDDDGLQRLHDGLYRVGKIHSELSNVKYMVKFDNQRIRLREDAMHAVGDLVIFILTQYNMYGIEDDGCYLSVNSYCEQQGITPSVFIGELLLDLEWSGCTPYGYESISEYRSALMDFDPGFLSECEEHAFPLTSDICEKILDKKLSLSEAREMLSDFLKQSEETAVEGMTPANMIKRMNLS